jgi:arylsulfatase A-like enzyme
VTSDHGEAFLQHGAQGHNSHVYEEMVHIPLVFWAPESDWPAGRVIEDPVSLLDLLPTFVEVFGLERPSQPVRGRSLADRIVSSEPVRASGPERPLFITSRHNAKLPRIHRAVRLGDHKLVLRTSREGETTQELYDLSIDALETKDLSDELPLRAAAMRDLLERWDAEARAEGLSQTSTPLDPERLEAIEALGYVSPDEEPEGEAPADEDD